MKLYARTSFYDSDTAVVALTKPDGRFGYSLEEIEVAGDVKPGDWVFMVTVTYTTGNSFGTQSGSKTLAAVLLDADKAFQLADAIKAHENKINSSEWKRTPHTWEEKAYIEFDGQKISAGDWTGYFESIDYVNVDRVAVGS
jgi:hypothetical protein